MKPTPLPTTKATPRDGARTPRVQDPTFGEMLEELLGLGGGLAIVLLPLFMLALPAVILFVLLPAIVLLVPAVVLAAVGAALATPPYLLARWLRRRRRAAPPSTGLAGGGLRPGRPERRRLTFKSSHTAA